MRVLIVTIIFISVTIAFDACGDDRYSDQISGRWAKHRKNTSECSCGECLDIQLNEKLPSFCVESNQIYVNVHYKLNRKRRVVYLFFSDVSEVGSGGAALPWEKFDKQEPLAEIDVSKVRRGMITIKWLGFKRKDRPSEKSPFGDAYTGIYKKWTVK